MVAPGQRCDENPPIVTEEGRGISSNTVYWSLRTYGEKAGLQSVRYSPHTFRHTFAKNFLLNGGDVFTLQKILGHSSLAVVRMYVDLASEDVQIQHRRYSPVDWMKQRSSPLILLLPAKQVIQWATENLSLPALPGTRLLVRRKKACADIDGGSCLRRPTLLQTENPSYWCRYSVLIVRTRHPGHPGRAHW